MKREQNPRGAGIPSAETERLNDLLHWIWSFRLQFRRMVESTKAEWNDMTDQRYARKAFSKTSYDEHMLTVAGRNLRLAADRAEELFPDLALDEEAKEALRLLRNMYEHWDEQREAWRSGAPLERSAKELTERFPEARPWSVEYTRDGVVLAGEVELSPLLKQLDALESEAIQIEDELKEEGSA